MVRSTILLLIGAALSAPACNAQPAAPPASHRDIADGRLMPAERLTDHVWYKRQPPRLWTAVIGDVGIVEQSDGIVLIDSGGSISDGRDIVADVARLTTKPIKAVVISHLHNDHSMGVAGILERYPNVRIISTAVTKDLLERIVSKNTGLGRNDPVLDKKLLEGAEERARDDEAKAREPGVPPDVREGWLIDASFAVVRAKRKMGNYIALPTEIFTHSFRIDDRIAPIELRYLGRSHSPGDLIAWLPKQRVLFTGDAVVSPSPYGYNSSLTSWIAVLQRIKQYDFRLLVPGHGAVHHDKSYLDTMIWSLRDVQKQAEKSLRGGKTAEQAWASFDDSEQAARFDARTAWTRMWLRNYWLEQLVSCAYREMTMGKVDYPG